MKKRSLHLSFVLLWMALFFCGVAAAQQSSVIVPNVEGVSQGIAAQILRAAGLQPSVQGSANSGTLVVRQDPHPGSLRPSGSSVVLYTESITPVTISSSASRGITPSIPATDSQPATRILPNVSVAPVVSVAPRTTQNMGYQITQDSANFIIARQPQQAPINRYLLTETTAKRYPIWYPRQYLELSARGQSVAVTSRVQAFPQSSVSPYLLTTVPASQPRSWEWYTLPQGWSTPQGWMTSQGVLTPQIQQTWTVPQGYYYTSSSPQAMFVQTQTIGLGSVPVPNVMRLRQADAMFAIQKAGLMVGNLILVQSAQVGSGVVINQSPRPRSIAQAGARVDLWIAN